MTQSSVAMVGLGNLGAPIALRLLDQGWSVSAVDVDVAQTEALEAHGARRVAAAQLADERLICMVVPGEYAIRAVLDEIPGELPTVVVLSTIAPATAVALGALVADRGGRMIDAPVSGGAARARQGDLSVYAGGSDADVDEARPLLNAIGSTVLHVGALGAGSAAKLANQLATFTTLAGVLEAVQLGVAHGIDEQLVIDALKAGTGDSWIARTWGFYDELEADYVRRGVPVSDRPWVKDLQAIRDAAAAHQTEVPIAELVAQLLTEQIDSHSRQKDGE